MWGSIYMLPFGIGPMVTWSLFSYVFSSFNSDLLAFFGEWSVYGTYFFNLIASYGDDIVFYFASSFVSSDYTSTSTSELYDLWPSYRTSFYVKTAANIFNMYATATYYDGWRKHNNYKMHARSSAQMASPYPYVVEF